MLGNLMFVYIVLDSCCYYLELEIKKDPSDEMLKDLYHKFCLLSAEYVSYFEGLRKSDLEVRKSDTEVRKSDT